MVKSLLLLLLLLTVDCCCCGEGEEVGGGGGLEKLGMLLHFLEHEFVKLLKIRVGGRRSNR